MNEKLGNVVHSDLIGHIGPASVGTARHILSFLIENSRFGRVFTYMYRSRLLGFLKRLRHASNVQTLEQIKVYTRAKQRNIFSWEGH